VRMPGIVISASVLTSRATKLHLQCRACRSTKIIYPQAGLGGLASGSDRGLPRVCDAPEPEGQKKDCPLDPYLIIHSKSAFADQQILKLQEAPDMVPVGELPRHMLLSADRYLTGKVIPGSRVIASGIFSQYQSAKNVRIPEIPLNHLLSAFAEKWGSCCFAAILYPPHPSRIDVTCRCGKFKSIRRPVYASARRRVWRNVEKRGFLRTIRKECCPKYLRKSRYSPIYHEGWKPNLP